VLQYTEGFDKQCKKSREVEELWLTDVFEHSTAAECRDRQPNS
jgi:hypothetical protein